MAIRVFVVVLFLFHSTKICVYSSDSSEHCGCHRTFHPVCGSDQKTYDSVCQLNCAQQRRPDLTVAYHGTCCPPAELCPIYHDPVCDNYGTTYENECIFTHRKCISLRLHGSVLRIAARGNCGARQAINRTECSFFCDERLEPVCDTLGKTHKNFCKFELTKCRLISRGMPPLEVKHWGKCEVEMKEIRRKESSHRISKPALRLDLSPYDKKVDHESEYKSSKKRDTYLERYGPFEYVRRSDLPPNPTSSEHLLSPITITPARSQSGTPTKTSSLLRAQIRLESAENLFEVQETTETARPDAAAAAYENDMLGDHHFDVVPERTTTTEYPFEHRKMAEAWSPTYLATEKPHREHRCSAEACDKTWDPVCDTRNKTHKNECMFRFYACKLMKSSNELVDISYKGECKKKNTLRREPPKELPEEVPNAEPKNCRTCDTEQEIVPVCDNMNQTHQSICLLAQWNCEQRRRGLDERVLVHIGHCHGLSPVFTLAEEACPSKCSKRYKPVCDTKGITHPNLCTFQMVNCKERQAGHRDASWLDYLHECIKPKFLDEAPKTLEMPMHQLSTASNIEKTSFLSELPTTLARSTTKPETTTTILPTTTTALIVPITTTTRAPVFLSSIDLSLVSATVTEKPRYEPSEVQTMDTLETNPATRKFMAEELPFETSVPALQPSLQYTSGLKEVEIVTTSIPEFECPEPNCEEVKNPVCDDDGTIHKNECLFTYARCLAAQKGKTLKLVPDEECQSPIGTALPQPTSDDDIELPLPPPTSILDTNQFQSSSFEPTFETSPPIAPINCSNEWSPVCGSDFITYPNQCILEQSQLQNGMLEMLFKGECELCLKTPCPLIDPETETDDTLLICDQVGETRSICEFKMLQCIYKLNTGENMAEAHKGRCCMQEDLCPSEENPVCDSVGHTHKNKCYFEVAKCRREKVEQVETITVAKSGSCSSYNFDNFRKTQHRPDILTNFKDSPTDALCEPSDCSNTYEPVCGSDRKTYPNMCIFKAKTSCNDTLSDHITVAYSGECCNFECTNEYSPICDNFGETHLNLCVFGKKRCLAERIKGQNLTISSYKPCENLDCAIECSQDYDPICGTDGRTYPNECMLKKIICLTSNIGMPPPILDYLGECCPDENCSIEFKPVCDSQGKTHVNDCIFRKNACLVAHKNGLNITVDYQGECCSRDCNSDWKPVCDGKKTHPNICMFRIKQCEAERRGEILSLAYAGECCLLPSGSCSDSGPLCDSDGQSHKNRCYFEQKKCITEKVQPKHLSVVHSGECCTIKHCSSEEEPVCDNRGGTHASLCHFQNTKCIHEKIHPNSTLLVSYKGTCCENHCDGTWKPVCDQHGTVYKNKCLFELRSCEYDKRSGTMLLQTPCTDSQTKRMLRHLLQMHRNR